MEFSRTIVWLVCLSLGFAPSASSATEPTSTAAISKAGNVPAFDLGALLDAGEGAIVTLVAGETRLAAHRAVLSACSHVFQSLFSNGSLQATSGRVDIPDVEGPVLRQLVAYCYTSEAPTALPGMAPQLLAAADQYGVWGLKAACERELVEGLAVQNAASLAVLAVRHSCPRLTEVAVAFLKANFFNVVGTKGWKDAILNHPMDLITVSQLLVQPPAETRTAAAAAAAGGSTPAAEWLAEGALEGPPHPPDEAAISRYRTAAAIAAAGGSTPAAEWMTEGAILGLPPPPDEAAISRYRMLSAKQQGQRLIEEAAEGAVEEVSALLAAGADVRASDWNGWTALHWAAAWGHAPAVRQLAAASADVNSRDKWGRTPLHFAAMYGYPEAAAALLAAGADSALKDDWAISPLDVARMKSKWQVVELLTESRQSAEEN